MALFGAKMGSGALPITWCSEAAVDPFELIPLALGPSATRLSPVKLGKHQENNQLHASIVREIVQLNQAFNQVFNQV